MLLHCMLFFLKMGYCSFLHSKYYYMQSVLFVGHLIFVFFVGREIYKFKIASKYLFSCITYNLKSMNSKVHEHVHRCKTTKFRAHEI